MKELRDELPDLNPSSVLDFGSGPGTTALAAWDVWGMEGGTVEDEDGQERWEEGDCAALLPLHALVDGPAFYRYTLYRCTAHAYYFSYMYCCVILVGFLFSDGVLPLQWGTRTDKNVGEKVIALCFHRYTIYRYPPPPCTG